MIVALSLMKRWVLRGICYTQHIYSLFWSPSADMCASTSFKQISAPSSYSDAISIAHCHFIIPENSSTGLLSLSTYTRSWLNPKTCLVQNQSRTQLNQISYFIVAHKSYPVRCFWHSLVCWLYPVVLPLLKTCCGLTRQMCVKTDYGVKMWLCVSLFKFIHILI